MKAINTIETSNNNNDLKNDLTGNTEKIVKKIDKVITISNDMLKQQYELEYVIYKLSKEVNDLKFQWCYLDHNNCDSFQLELDSLDYFLSKFYPIFNGYIYDAQPKSKSELFGNNELTLQGVINELNTIKLAPNFNHIDENTHLSQNKFLDSYLITIMKTAHNLAVLRLLNPYGLKSEKLDGYGTKYEIEKTRNMTITIMTLINQIQKEYEKYLQKAQSFKLEFTLLYDMLN